MHGSTHEEASEVGRKRLDAVVAQGGITLQGLEQHAIEVALQLGFEHVRRAPAGLAQRTHVDTTLPRLMYDATRQIGIHVPNAHENVEHRAPGELPGELSAQQLV